MAPTTARHRPGSLGWWTALGIALALTLANAGAAPQASARPDKTKHDKIVPAPVDPRPTRIAGTLMPKRAASVPIAEVDAALVGANATTPRDLRILVIAADGVVDDLDLAAVRSYLGRVGIPYDVMFAASEDLTAARLEDSTHGRYSAVILTTGNLAYWSPDYTLPFTNEEWQILHGYEARYGVRQVTTFTSPTDAYNLTYEGAMVPNNLVTWLTTDGQSVFGDLNPSTAIPIRWGWVYLALVGTRTDVTTVPLLETTDGHVIASVTTFADGRENLAITAGNSPQLLHTQLLAGGIIDWVTKGLYLGERHVNLDAQVDDLFLDDDVWDSLATGEDDGPWYRMDATDVTQLVAWQQSLDASSQLATVRLELAFNGEGTTGIYPDDTLTAAAKANQAHFSWINHSWSHESFDYPASANTIYREISRNDAFARTFAFTSYVRDALVQPDLSGLDNGAFWAGASKAGIRYVLSDLSKPSTWTTTEPNVGVQGPKGILVIPRRANNLFYNVTTPDEWVDEYNYNYWGWHDADGVFHEGQWHYWDVPQTYEQILDHESDFLLGYLLAWDLDPWMFHQANLAAYDGTRSLLGDLLDRTLEKYLAHYGLPIRNLSQHDVGVLMTHRMAYNASGVTASVRPCTSITMRVTKSAQVPITGVQYGSNYEQYGGTDISYVNVTPKRPVTIPLTCPAA
jgi:hypothetical protein